MTNAALRGCPTCGTPVAEVALGLRDHSWVDPLLPGKVGGMDIDFMLERKGKVLVMEYKPANGHVGRGQSITFRTLRTMGADVWIVYGDGPMVDVDWGDGRTRISVDELAQETLRWFEASNA